MGGINIGNCNGTCYENCLPEFIFDNDSLKTIQSTNWTNSLNDFNDISNEILDEHAKSKSYTKKYSFDVVDDQHDPLHITEKEDNGNFSYDDTTHKRIVRVSLQKAIRKNQGACFRGNDSLALHDIKKIINTADKYQNNVNIRFKTSYSNGLILLIYQTNNKAKNIFSLTIEDG